MTADERREIEESLRIPRRFRIEQTVRYEHLFDEPISPACFEFVVPIRPET